MARWARNSAIAGGALIATAVIVGVVIAVDAGGPVRRFVARTSLVHGWLPTVVQVIATVVLLYAVGRRSRRWQLQRLPVALIVGAGVAAWTHWYVGSIGVAGDPAPVSLWIWVSLTGIAVVVALLGWRGARWSRRGASVLAVPLCVLSAALAVNLWVGYFPTVATAWSQLTGGALPDETDRATVTAMQLEGSIPAEGVVVPVTIGARSSKFHHRAELVYLPPAWFASNPPPKLPVVMMIGAEFNTPTDWLRAGNVVKTADRFAAAHGGNVPVLVFVDSGGAFNVDTECVNGGRGNAADHLTKDIVPFMVSDFGVSADRANWGVAGFSSGGTCALDLAVMHPELFSAFVDIAGDLGPNTGSKAQTISRLFGGNADAWAAFDPSTVISRHGPYHHAVAGWFTVAAPGSPNADVAARTLCALGHTREIDCAIVPQQGKHDWAFAAEAFPASLPWLAGRLGTPAVPRSPLPSVTVASSRSNLAGAPGPAPR